MNNNRTPVNRARRNQALRTVMDRMILRAFPSRGFRPLSEDPTVVARKMAQLSSTFRDHSRHRGVPARIRELRMSLTERLQELMTKMLTLRRTDPMEFWKPSFMIHMPFVDSDGSQKDDGNALTWLKRLLEPGYVTPDTVRGYHDWTWLMYAIEFAISPIPNFHGIVTVSDVRNRMAPVRALISLGADVNARARYGKTPLMIAVDKLMDAPQAGGRLQLTIYIIALLIESGADPTLRDYTPRRRRARDFVKPKRAADRAFDQNHGAFDFIRGLLISA